MTDFDRRQLVLAGAAIVLGTQIAGAQNRPAFAYRGITVDTSASLISRRSSRR